MDGDLITSPRERTWLGPRLAVSLPMNAALPSAQAPRARSFAGLFLPQIRLNLGEKTLIACHNGSPFLPPKAIQGEVDGIHQRVGSYLVAF
jgi:hypothetical protein